MNKYLRASICEGVTLLKFFYLKILHRKKFACSFINICSPLSGNLKAWCNSSWKKIKNA